MPNTKLATVPAGPTMSDEVTFISGINANGQVAAISGLTWNGDGAPDGSKAEKVATYNPTVSTAAKWGAPAVGSGGGLQLYYFNPDSNWTAAEKTVFATAFASWSAVANIQFAETTDPSKATVDFVRTSSGGNNESGGADLTEAIGSTSLVNQGNAVSINIDTVTYNDLI